MRRVKIISLSVLTSLFLTYLSGVEIIGYGLVKLPISYAQAIYIHESLAIVTGILSIILLIISIKQNAIIKFLSIINLAFIGIAGLSGYYFVNGKGLIFLFSMETFFILSTITTSLVLGLSVVSLSKSAT